MLMKWLNKSEKYLMIPNLLILIALDIQQLSEILSKEFGTKKINLSEQYIEKIFPRRT